MVQANKRKLGLVIDICIVRTWERKAGGWGAQSILGYIVSLRTAWATRDHSSIKQKKEGRGNRKKEEQEGEKEGGGASKLL